MNHDDTDRRWAELVARARSDSAPLTDTASLLRVLAENPQVVPETLLEAFARRFATPGGLLTCFGSAVAATLLLAWQLRDLWHAAPWAELLTLGGLT